MSIHEHRYEPTDSRLGRHVKHDERSRSYSFSAPSGTAIKTVDWPVHRTLDQGNVGSCTGNALTQWLNTDFAQSKRAGFLTETDAVVLYSAATRLDNVAGQYPPNDTGSDGLSVCKAGVRLGYLTGYQHVFTFEDLLLTLQHTPVIVGTEWLRGMFSPAPKTGIIPVSGAVEGGHEYLVRGVNVEKKLITIHNSWGSSWGINGDAYIRFSSFRKLLSAQGDVTVPVI